VSIYPYIQASDPESDTNTFYRLTKLVQEISKKPVPAHTKNLILEICADDETGEDVEVPYICVRIR